MEIIGRSASIKSVGRLPRCGRTRLNTSEVATLCAWPIGRTSDLPVITLGSRRLPVPAAVKREGLVLGEATWPGTRRTLALSEDDVRRHLHALGPTGTGKSTLMLNLITQDIAAGRGVVVVDPKRDLIKDVLAHIPPNRIDDVVVLDPTDTEATVGINPLASDRGHRETRADQLLEVLHRLYAANWGPRTSDILGAALLTLARTDHASLVAVPHLLTNPAFRRRVVSQVSDPAGLDAFWASFEAWTDAERTTAIAPVLNKLRPFLVRPNLRRIVGQTKPRFDVTSVLNERKILLVDLAVGQIGSEAASLLGALVMTHLWQAVQARTAVAPERRLPVTVYLDEMQTYLALPVSLSDALEQARGLNVAYVLAHQHLGQLSSSMKAAVLANARSRICFQLGRDDAKAMSESSSLLGAEDFAGLEAFHFYAQLVADGAVQPWCSGRSLPAVAPTSDPLEVRQQARINYATPNTEVDDEIAQLLVHPNPRRPADDLGPRRRQQGGAA